MCTPLCGPRWGSVHAASSLTRRTPMPRLGGYSSSKSWSNFCCHTARIGWVERPQGGRSPASRRCGSPHPYTIRCVTLISSGAMVPLWERVESGLCPAVGTLSTRTLAAAP